VQLFITQVLVHVQLPVFEMPVQVQMLLSPVKIYQPQEMLTSL